jgi:hypothetical protein
VIQIMQNVIPVEAIHPHPRNFREHPESQLAQLEASYERFGQFRSIVVQVKAKNDYLLVAGHGIFDAMKRKGATEVRADVLPTNLAPAEVEAIMIADNLLPQLANDDEVGLSRLLQEQQEAGYDLRSLGTDEEMLRQMLANLGDESGTQDGQGAGGDDFDVEPEEEQTCVKPGDIWQLGKHRIGCLNALDAGQVNRLLDGKVPQCVFADPPYGVQERTFRKTAGRGKLAGCNDFPSVIGDDNHFDPSLLLQVPAQVKIIWGANYFADKLPITSSWIVWDKRDGIPSNDNADCELAWTNAGGPARLFTHRWNGMIKASEQNERRLHPTQKPIALAQWCFEKYSKDSDLIYDPFLGSGISVIAGERLERTVYGCELSPAYINVVIQRWEKETGQTAHLLERAEVPS